MPVVKGVRSPGIEITDGCEMQCKCWGLNWHRVEGQPVLLTTQTLSSPIVIMEFLFLSELVCFSETGYLCVVLAVLGFIYSLHQTALNLISASASRVQD